MSKGQKGALMKKLNKCIFIDEKGTFRLENADRYTALYFPIAGEAGLKSAVAPDLAGDAKLDQNHFLLEPVSSENLHNNRNTRNFWVLRDGKKPWSLTGNSVWQKAEDLESTTVEAGFMWHKISRTSADGAIEATVLSFVPVNKNVEIHVSEITNLTDADLTLRFVAAVPVYGRSADNIRDHRHVTSLLHRTVTTRCGVNVCPTLSFDERGHQVNDTTYFVSAMGGDGEIPAGFVPEVSAFIGEGGAFDRPLSLCGNIDDVCVKEGFVANGVESVGGIVFNTVTVKAHDKVSYVTFAGCEPSNNFEDADKNITATLSDYKTVSDIYAELENVKEYWTAKVNVSYHTGNPDFDGFMSWVSFQPELRRVYGCSFLPHHDYGRGGRGWRDLWQDCLALLLMNPDGVRKMLVSNFEGVRTDGTNATIIGSKLGEFKADRNGITRVWMDHAMWPLLTTALYIDQTGDLDILLEEIPYYKDKQVLRGTGIDEKWDGVTLRELDGNNEKYRGTILEHLMLETLAEFWEVGEHNNLRLRDADWNDAVDMAGKRGESVAFTHAYAGNLEIIAGLVKELAAKNPELSIMEELVALLNDDAALYEDVKGKNEVLMNYAGTVKHGVTGKKVSVKADDIITNLTAKAAWMKEHLRKNEWVTDSEGNSRFNGYYDNDSARLEGDNVNGPQMTLTGQVFAIMSGTATDDQIKDITKSADALLYDPECGGYRLNTNFNEVKTNMGRMFGFAFGEKENGAVFSHMAVMYANALYKRGFAREGFKSLNTLFTQSMTFDKGRIYPGIPEYFGRGGRGLYHYLTGAASWYMMTVVNEMFGVKGALGGLEVSPKLLKEQFDQNGQASISLTFRGKQFKVTYLNKDMLEYGDYAVSEIEIDGTKTDKLSKELIEKLGVGLHLVNVKLERK